MLVTLETFNLVGQVSFIGPISVFPQALVLCYKYLTTARLRMLIASLISFAVILFVVCCIKKRKMKAKSGHSNPIYGCSELDPAAERITVKHSNSTYDVIEYESSNQKEDHEYFMMVKMSPPKQSKSQSDVAEQWYDDIRNKDLVDKFALQIHLKKGTTP